MVQTISSHPIGGPMQTIKVWDLFVRVFHWALVAAILSQLITAEDFQSLHVRVGYGIILLLVLRIIWGFVGTRHARFRDFLYPPADILTYLKGLFQGTARRYTGHNPAGGAMVVALLVVLSLTTSTGLLTDAAEGNGIIALDTVNLVKPALADDDDYDDGPRASDHREHDSSKEMTGQTVFGKDPHFWKEIHESLVGLLIALAAVHFGGVLASSYAHKENLIRAMITGRKKNG